MSKLRLGIRDNRKEFSPGDEIAGAALWELDEAPESAEVSLVWNTRGKGTEDAEVAEIVYFDVPNAGDTRDFKLKIPNGPYTFSGKLISLVWALELVLQPGDHLERVEITIAPGGREVVLPTIEQPRKPSFSMQQ